MQVIKRDGSSEPISFDKITKRINDLVDCGGRLQHVDPVLIAKETINGIYNGIKTTELDVLSADICATKSHHHPEYNKLGGRILVSNIVKTTSNHYMDVVTQLYTAGILSKDFYDFVNEHSNELQEMIDYQRDYMFDYFAIKTLERSYLFKISGVIIERPQHMWMRVAIQTGLSNMKNIKESYELMSTLYFTHATPTLFNSGTKHPQLSSCFLTSSEDNLEDIFKTISDVAKISKWAGGIGLSLSNIRAKGSMIRGTNGKSEGIIPLCKTLEIVGRYINQGGKRNGSIACYLEPFHADIESFIELRKNTGDENLRTRDLFIALWIPDLFMKRVQSDEEWTLMCPNECPGLVDSFGEAFETLYTTYEKDKKGKKTIRARDLWNKILENQIETGMPYISFKDSVNRRNMQQHVGVIRNSNLCNEIALYSDKENIAVCNLSSICLPRFVENGSFNFEKLRHVAGVCTRNLNNVIDVNFYPTPETRKTNMEHRPIGIGIQGLADVYCMLGYPFGCDEARSLNRLIFENIYYGSVDMSIQLAKKDGPFPSFSGYNSENDSVNKSVNNSVNKTESLHAQGKLQFDLYTNEPFQPILTLDWDYLKNEMSKYGIRNSMLTALMPTASTSQIMCNNECFEPYTSNIYLRKTLAGEFTVVNQHLINDLLKLGLWNQKVYEEILFDNGSVQKIKSIPDHIKNIYKTAFEIKITDMLKQAVERSPFIDHMQSMNLFMAKPDFNLLNSSHFYSWKHGLKTGMYYLRTQPAADAVKFGIDANSVKRIKDERKQTLKDAGVEDGSCPRDPYLRSICDSCSS